ncbi:Thiol:disulfide interchange protein DsbG precursor [Cedecea neteri]|uniref:Thiol:disulfide interchange protein DsbG n=1 Tax=Cedecea neteri TaxID=158822 RepID=A0A2X3J0B5_9ENTR|nr:Thiol:disulfide interchange protein DsbG precursor [Cedecea neteri]
MIDTEGKNLSDAEVEKFVYAPMAKEMWQNLEKHRWIAAGGCKSAAHSLRVCRSVLPVLHAVLGTGSALAEVG